MSVEQMGMVWKLKLPHNQAWLLMALADHAHDDGSKCHPGLPRLSWKTGYGLRQVRRIIGALRAEGIIEAISHTAGGRSASGKGYATEYRLHLDKADKKPPYVWDTSARGAVETGLGGPGSPARGAVETGNADIAIAAQPSVTIIEPSEEPSLGDDGLDKIPWVRTLRSVDGWGAKGEPHMDSLLRWISDKGWTLGQLEAAAIGLADMADKTLKGKRDLSRTFQRRLNEGYDRVPVGRGQPGGNQAQQTSGRAYGWDGTGRG